jgi:hypothetical protein
MTSRATSHEHVAPKLPSRSPDEVQSAFVAANAIPEAQVEPSRSGPRPPAAYENPVVFEVPELLPLRGVSIAWTAARFAIVVWTAAIAFVAIRTTNRIDAAAPDRSIAAVGDDMTIVVLVGLLLLAALFAASLLWSRVVAENTRRLRGRWPSLNRATRVWFYPTVWVALAALTFLRIDVTAEFDPLPAIAAIVFALTLLRPYAMIQRIFKTLTRVRPEGEIRALYLLDLAGFGIIWWRLTDWPDPITAADAGTVDAMAWASIASSGLLLISAGITASLARQAIGAHQYRIRVLATRHIQGLALPLVPRKAWGRERTSIDDAATRGAGPVGDVVRAADLVIGPGGAPSAAVAAARRTTVPARGFDVAARSTSTVAGDRPAPRPTRAAGGAEADAGKAVARAGETPGTRRRPVPGAAGQVAARRRPGAAPEGGSAAARRRPGAAAVRGGGPPNRRAPMGDAVAARRQPGIGQRGPAGGRRAAVPGAAGAAVARRRAASTSTGDMATRRALAAEAAARRRAAAGLPTEAVERSDVGDESGKGVVGRASSTAGRVTLPSERQEPPREVRSAARVIDADEPPRPTTIVGSLRFTALGGHVVIAATFVWFVVESRSAAAASGGGNLDPTHLDRLDLVRTANVVAFAVTVLLLGAWGTATSMLAQRSGRPAPPPLLVLTFCLPATLFLLAGLVIDTRVGAGVLFSLAVLAAGLGGAGSLALLSKMQREVDDSSHGTLIWAAVILVVGLGLTVGDYLQPIEPGQSLSTLTLIAILMGILLGLGVLLGSLASGEVHDYVEERVLVDSDWGN